MRWYERSGLKTPALSTEPITQSKQKRVDGIEDDVRCIPLMLLILNRYKSHLEAECRL